ncbi:bifunctional hydroxymethylpyrimidine kinase/phosphomethylpyrimidine kinase [Paenibacillus nasutitermitis]|uniref:Hydroxymethylpyrimidine/phosphomethylpyrimidine kinase n=1 Tax=Paenibacillus nasutitermitis TaxID=1652958 RepID=A0A916YPW9_9BACL|nr:bifunctional hydroxymethylpyrimidine kinase/phosphomethylpyrimidine kinase [Paenibacillus nasutitermitis]GGD55548.1 hydroxymethylpyrimidine/phosphomethylpyrimidine kinase [Paenibacillus nasutitermitis]
MKIGKALTIAGSDSGGGAGIQADIKTFQELGVYGMSAITAVTAQNTLGVQGVYPMSVEAVARQLDSIGTDLRPDALKTGMLFSGELIKAVAGKVKQYGWQHLVVDPVMVAKGGSQLLKAEAVDTMISHLIPLATVVTPNIPEAEALTGIRISSRLDKMKAARAICQMGARYAVIKGGHEEGDERQAVDLFSDGEWYEEYAGPRIDTRHTHGTGCTFSAAIAAELAQGKPIREAVRIAKAYIQAAISHSLHIGGGSGPTNHWAYRLEEREPVHE